jgi:hypothetical protein
VRFLLYAYTIRSVHIYDAPSSSTFSGGVCSPTPRSPQSVSMGPAPLLRLPFFLRKRSSSTAKESLTMSQMAIRSVNPSRNTCRHIPLPVSTLAPA